MEKSVINKQQLIKIVDFLKNGFVIAYPTEGVFGLGCDPFNEKAVKKILYMKQRDVDKGLILIASSFEQIMPFLSVVSDEIFSMILKTKTPTSWVYPKSDIVPYFISGSNNSICFRITKHRTAKTICEAFGGPIVSTSANPGYCPPAVTRKQVRTYFQEEVDFIVDGKVGKLNKATPIMNALTLEVIRK